MLISDGGGGYGGTSWAGMSVMDMWLAIGTDRAEVPDTSGLGELTHRLRVHVANPTWRRCPTGGRAQVGQSTRDTLAHCSHSPP